MKLYYIETNGYNLVAGEDNGEVRCFQHDDPLCVCYMDYPESEKVARQYLEEIDPACFWDWEAEGCYGNPYTIEELTDGCEILAELELAV